MSRQWSVCLILAAGSAVSAQESTWDIIRHDILNANCANCHTAGTSFARQSDLILTPDEAYGQLVDVPPRNEAAREDGLLRVSSIGQLPGIEQSYLWEKINVVQQDHLHDDHPEYGALMPLGQDPLTNGELSFIEQWMLEGAPETGVVADIALLEDTSMYAPHTFEPLPVPQNGIQLHVGPFDIWPAERYDRELYYFEPVQADEPMYVNQYEVRYREGSHHFILDHYEQGDRTPPTDTFRDIRDENGRSLVDSQDANSHADFILATQTPDFSYSFPEGVALRLPSTAGFDLNVHSVNRTEEIRQGEVYVNLHTADPSEIVHIAEQKSFSNFLFSLPPNQVTTLSKTFRFSDKEHIVQLWSHAHEHMVEFRVEYAGGERDGELIYWTNDWEHPPVAEYDDPLVFEAGDQIRLVTTYNNDTDKTLRFGLLSSDEMQFLFFVSYPLTGDLRKDGVLDAADIDLLTRRLDGAYSESVDLNHDGVLDSADRAFWVERLAGTFFGDVNLDQSVGFDDFLALSNSFGQEGGWGDGDVDGNGTVDFPDFLLLSANYGLQNQTETVAVPEPSAWGMAVYLMLLFGASWRRGLLKNWHSR